jgi:AcrR family transcriptional regulator
MPELAELAMRRPRRADARRNYDALVAAARAAFAELGTNAPLEEIARRADVGIATLYRNFPTREDLVESVYLSEVEAVVAAADEVKEMEPWSALVTWLDRLVAYIGTKKALIDGLNKESRAYKNCRDELYAAGGPLVERAHGAGVLRADANIDDVMRLVTGVTAAGFTSMQQRDKVLSMALDGLRPRA